MFRCSSYVFLLTVKSIAALLGSFSGTVSLYYLFDDNHSLSHFFRFKPLLIYESLDFLIAHFFNSVFLLEFFLERFRPTLY